MKSVHLIVSGKVQGVFFRDNSRRKAIELGLNGYARNLPDGTVEIELEGGDDRIEIFLGFIKKNPGESSVKETMVNSQEPKNFKSFEIKH